MRGAALLLPIAIALVTAIALAQGANDPLVQLRACSLMEGADRMECLDRLLRAAASPAHPALGWVISQTTSPVDYAPIATATTSSHKLADGSALQLSIRCRGGRTDLALIGPAVSGRADDYSI